MFAQDDAQILTLTETQTQTQAQTQAKTQTDRQTDRQTQKHANTHTHNSKVRFSPILQLSVYAATAARALSMTGRIGGAW